MPHFFIDRPIFAWVVALSILLAGALCFKALPITQYPEVAPPGLTVSAIYPGASAQLVEESVTRLIEESLNGIDDLLYMEASSDTTGAMTLNLTFKTGIDLDIATVQTQNRIKRIEARLPEAVRLQGISVTESRRNYLMFVAIFSPQQSLDAVALGSYTAAQIVNAIRQVKGVGDATLFGTEYAMRIWLDRMAMTRYRLGPEEVVAAIRAQNIEVAAGEIGQLPLSNEQLINASIVIPGRKTTAESFSKIILKMDALGRAVYLSDVAKVELGAQNYLTRARLNGRPIAAVGIKLSPEGNALETAAAIREKMEQLSRFFPDDMAWDVPYDTSQFIDISIEQVVTTLIEAFILVFLVMLLFMGSLRAAFIPTIVVPISLIGALVGLYLLGYSINVLTLFAMVLSIGTVVDDAIVVVENAQRIIDEEQLSPREAAHKAMSQIINPIIGITIVLCAVFIPMAFFGGSVGAIYKQFSVTLVLTLIFSTLLALTLSPALCAALLKPKRDRHTRHAVLAPVNRLFEGIKIGYLKGASWMTIRPVRVMLIYLVMMIGLIWAFWRLPTGFLPDEDQGYFITVIQLPEGATQSRTLSVLERVEAFALAQPEVEKVVGVLGFSFFGNGQNAAIAFIRLKDWQDRPNIEQQAQQVIQRMNHTLLSDGEAFIFSVNPPAIPELAAIGGFDFRLQDRADIGRAALRQEAYKIVGLASEQAVLSGVRPEGKGASPQLELMIDREKAASQGVSIQTINRALSIAFGSLYVNDFLKQGRVLQVIVQFNPDQLKDPESLLTMTIKNRLGQSVVLSEFVSYAWRVGSGKLDRYNGLPAIKIAGNPAPGYTTGQALNTMESLTDHLSPGFSFQWSGTSFEERLSGSQAPILFSISILIVFMCLAALYESWSVPFTIILVVPLGILGAVAGLYLRDLPNDVYFKVGLIAIIGLSAKNAILIVEFALKELQAGKGVYDAVHEACRLRFRPIIMTSITFIIGVLPLAISTGAGAASRIAVGTGVMGGMIAATVLAIFFVPVQFVAIEKIFPYRPKKGDMVKANGDIVDHSSID